MAYVQALHSLKVAMHITKLPEKRLAVPLTVSCLCTARYAPQASETVSQPSGTNIARAGSQDFKVSCDTLKCSYINRTPAMSSLKRAECVCKVSVT